MIDVEVTIDNKLSGLVARIGRGLFMEHARIVGFAEDVEGRTEIEIGPSLFSTEGTTFALWLIDDDLGHTLYVSPQVHKEFYAKVDRIKLHSR